MRSHDRPQYDHANTYVITTGPFKNYYVILRGELNQDYYLVALNGWEFAIKKGEVQKV